MYSIHFSKYYKSNIGQTKCLPEFDFNRGHFIADSSIHHCLIQMVRRSACGTFDVVLHLSNNEMAVGRLINIITYVISFYNRICVPFTRRSVE